MLTDLVPTLELDVRRHSDDLRQTWQARALDRATERVSIVNAHVRPRDAMGAVILSILSHSFDDQMPVLAILVHNGFGGWTGNIVCSIGRINKQGHVVADFMESHWIEKRKVLFDSDHDFRGKLRDFADRINMSDQERLEFFTCARRWLAADERLDPSMDPHDPDAKRLVH